MRAKLGRNYGPLGGVPTEKDARKHAPFPGLIDGHKWNIEEGRWPAFIDRRDLEGEGGVMHVPLEGTPEDRKLRLHEQAHVAWTPNVNVHGFTDVSAETIGACEDARLTKQMGERHQEWKEINEKVDCMPPPIVMRYQGEFELLSRKLTGALTEQESKMQRVMPLVHAGRLIAMTRGYYESRYFDKMAKDVGLGWAVKAVNQMHSRHLGKKAKPTFENTVAYARELEQYFSDMEEAIGAQQQELDELELVQEFPRVPELWPEDGKWGRMTIEEAPLTERLQGSPARRTRATDMGAVPRYMHRLPTDQKVFGRRRKTKDYYQGTVLIDHSGSMNLEPEEVDEILARWPAVTIATYSGTSEGYGRLRVVAKNGRRATTMWLGPPSGGDNMVDGPALDWLASQKGPRIWISDGYVTGIGGHTGNLLADAAKKVKKGKIKRIENVQELIRGKEKA